jgi:membrane protease YdiL (CAAX protease family)
VILAFFFLTYLVGWVFFGVGAAVSGGALRNAVLLPGVFAPAIVALLLTARSEGREGVQNLLGRILQRPVAARWYVFAATYMISIKLAAALLHRVVAGEWPAFGQEPWYVLIGATILSTPVQAGEELGWRGYALPRLAARMGLAKGSVVLGIVWACWHLPFFFMAGTDTSGQSFPLYLVQVTGFSVAMAFLFWRAGGSLLPVMLLHAAANNTKDAVPSAEPGAANPLALSHSLVAWLTVALLWICASYFLRRMRGVRRVGPQPGPA